MTGLRKGPDRRSAIEKIAADPLSRRKFLAVGGGTASVALLAACGSDEEESDGMTSAQESSTTSTTESSGAGDPLADFGEGDLAVVNYALTLEYLESAFYDEVAKSGLFKGDDLALIKAFGQDESDHVKALEQTAKQLGKPAKAPKTNFEIKDAQSVLETAAMVENLGANAYLGAAPLIKNEDILAAALSIHSVEARHAATLNQIIGESFVPDGPFAVPAEPADVLEQVKPFIAS